MSGSGCLYPHQQRAGLWHLAFGFIAKHRFAIDEDGHVAILPGFECGFDSKLLFGGLLQAHGCTADVQSKETAADFDHHLEYASGWLLYCVGSRGTNDGFGLKQFVERGRNGLSGLGELEI